MFFLGRALRHGGAGFYKLSLFRRGKGHFECRLKDQDASMADMEVHEHVVVEGKTARLKNPLLHHNVESLSRYIQKHDEYSNWDARVWLEGEANSAELPPSLFREPGAAPALAAQRDCSRFPVRRCCFFFTDISFAWDFWTACPGLIYCGFQGMQFFHIKAKIYELRRQEGLTAGSMCGISGVGQLRRRETLARMTAIQAHRGPDDSGLWEQRFPDGSYFGLGSRRLAILDLSPDGHMPMCNRGRTLWITYNGEIYNFARIAPRAEEQGAPVRLGHRYRSGASPLRGRRAGLRQAAERNVRVRDLRSALRHAESVRGAGPFRSEAVLLRAPGRPLRFRVGDQGAAASARHRRRT